MSCRFAHGESELRIKPDLTKTTLCHFMTDRGYCKSRDCKFAHDSSEIRDVRSMVQFGAHHHLRSGGMANIYGGPPWVG
eukprot:CAMPEP_0115517158 /NCGR_PEP_ID=MMETSP0271-20121206/77166_1 /TAXON_ID=71861 /ORGANISM="Scrippsiella trochoidea, Strain CCMP3099" /LENGTH=78 /DNA_ID=CAMNT_0002947909 /DNA_START=16 /DNA_END=248 /DNA_ORIENTATION=-